MPRTSRTVTPEPATPVNRTAGIQADAGEGTVAYNGSNGNGLAVKSLVDHVEQIKDALKTVIRDLTTVIDLVKAAEKEKRTSEKEIEAIRAKLRQIQSVNI